FRETVGQINPNLTVGVDITQAEKLRANAGICFDGIKLHGKGFALTRAEAEYFGFGKADDGGVIIRPYLNGRDVNQRSRGLYVIDLYGYTADQAREEFPAVYQHLLEKVKPK